MNIIFQVKFFVFLLTCFFFVKYTAAAEDKLIVLTEENWRDSLVGEWMIKFYAPWCPACRENEPDFRKFSQWSDDFNIKVAVVDITKEAGLSGRFMVTALPTFYHGIDGEFRRYSGQRDADSLHHYFDEKVHYGVEPIHWIRHPDSVQMTLMSWLFKTSIIMKDTHEMLTTTYGLSTWMSYVIFGVGTLITGLTLGLLLVCIVDCISPPKPGPSSAVRRVSEDEKKEEKKDEETKEDPGDDAEDSEASQESEASQQASQSSQSSSRATQDWETIQDSEIMEADEDATEGGVRKRKGGKPEESKEAGDVNREGD